MCEIEGLKRFVSIANERMLGRWCHRNGLEIEGESLPRFRSLDEFVEFFDTHDVGEYWDEMPEAHFEDALRRCLDVIF